MIVKCKDLKKYFTLKTGALRNHPVTVKAVDGVSCEIASGETFGLVGESGCGKTTLGKIMLGILKEDSGTLELGTRRLQVIFQDPYNSLDPKMKIFDILAEGLILKGEPTHAIKEKVSEILDLVKLPKESLKKYPHQFSGGERQRIAIGRALLTDPELIVCDEPVSNLDVTIQLEILKLLKKAQKKFSITYLFISHDLRVIKFMCDRIAIMKEGKIVEEGLSENIYSNPHHPYTKLLVSTNTSLYRVQI